jgi:hypothetical protein
MISDALRQALAIMDGSSGGDRASLPREPGLQWGSQGSRLTLAAEYGPALERAARAEVALYGESRIAFALAIRFFDHAGNVSPWALTVYGEPGGPDVPRIDDPKMLPDEERILEVVSVNPGTGRPGTVRSLPISVDFAFALRRRVQVSRDCNGMRNGVKNVAEQFARAGCDGVERATARFSGDLYPPVDPFLEPESPAP